MRFTSAAGSVLGREAVRELDARTIAGGTASLVLMERAGEALAAFVADAAASGVQLPAAGAAARLLVVAGRGNNGGDGFVVARLLAASGWHCAVALAGAQPAPGADAAFQFAEWRRAGGTVVGPGELVGILSGGAGGFDLGLDAIFGTGLARNVEGPDADLIHCMNHSGLPMIAADIPSGLCSDTGRPLGVAVRARATLAIGVAKPGLFLAEGPDFSGRIQVADIGLLDPATTDRCGVVLSHATMASSWPRLARLAHKGSRGHVLIVAGSRGKTGAAVLAARAALRAGAGLVTVASVAEVQAAVAAALPEAMTAEVAADCDGRIDRAGVAALVSAASTADAIVVGPGLGTGAGAQAAVEALIAAATPLILDADALNVVAGWSHDRRAGVFAARISAGAPPPVLTPHPGEMGRLCGQSTAEIQQKRDEIARKLAKQLGAVVVLKGAATIVSHAGRTAYNLSGNPGMASAGMGDVLSGICGALAARKTGAEAAAPGAASGGESLDPFDRACLAVFVHGAAGDHLAAQAGPGFLAGELADRVPAELARLLPR